MIIMTSNNVYRRNNKDEWLFSRLLKKDYLLTIGTFKIIVSLFRCMVILEFQNDWNFVLPPFFKAGVRIEDPIKS